LKDCMSKFIMFFGGPDESYSYRHGAHTDTFAKSCEKK